MTLEDEAMDQLYKEVSGQITIDEMLQANWKEWKDRECEFCHEGLCKCESFMTPEEDAEFLIWLDANIKARIRKAQGWD